MDYADLAISNLDNIIQAATLGKELIQEAMKPEPSVQKMLDLTRHWLPTSPGEDPVTETTSSEILLRVMPMIQGELEECTRSVMEDWFEFYFYPE